MNLTIDGIFELYEREGARHYGEGVSQLDHGLQCAQLAAADGADEALVAAALLHDIGHLLGDATEVAATDDRHELWGAAALRRLFGREVVQPIALHVAAKRYLCATEGDYFEGLSAASRRSLVLQGGPLSPEQGRRFEAGGHFSAAVRLRRYDDAGKVAGAERWPLRDYRGLLCRLSTARE
jgi:phosphonate degradation associated HDIG domain protein